MQTARRLYLYAVAYVSLVTVLWGAIGLLRSIFAGQEIGGSVSRLAGALSLILVGVPVFTLHWWLAQRSGQQNPEERSSGLRAVFLYGVMLTTLIPIIQNFLALASRSLSTVLGGLPGQALFGWDQSLSDNLVAIIVNGLMAFYFFSVLRADWKAIPQGDAYVEVQRLFRYLLMLYGLAMIVFGFQQAFQFILEGWQTVGTGARSMLANGLALLLVGMPLWILSWRQIQSSLVEKGEADSLLRLTLLSLLIFVSAVVVLISVGMIIYELLRYLLGRTASLADFVGLISGPLSVAISFGTVWAYFRRFYSQPMQINVASSPAASQGDDRLKGLRRFFYYLLALLGLGATFIGLLLLFSFLIDLTLGESVIWGGVLIDNLAASLSTLMIGIPLWLIAWRTVTKEAGLEGEIGDHARQSVVRKGYLYLVLFTGVIGVMFSTGVLLFQVISALLGDPVDNMLVQAVEQLEMMLLFVVLLAYHWRVLRHDTRLSTQALSKRHAQFPVLVMATEQGEFAEGVLAMLEREIDELPVAVHLISQGAPDETLSAAKAVIFPAEIIAKPPESIRLWLQGYGGVRLVVPTPADRWHWVSGSGRSIKVLLRQTACIVRQLAEGEEVTATRDTSPWMIVVYIFAGLVALQIISGIIGILSSFMLD